MTRNQIIERVLRQIYNGQPSDDSNITYGLVNQWLNDAIGVAAKKNYTDNIQLDGVAYVNNSFYTTFKDIAITDENNFTYKIALPQLPVALGRNEGVASLQFKGSKATDPISHSAIPLSVSQLAYIENIRPIQNKILFWHEGDALYAKSTVNLTRYKGIVRMVSGGDSANLNSTLLIPDDYMPVIIEYIKGQLAFEKSRPIDQSNDGVDN
jgi:hypothetical protein